MSKVLSVVFLVISVMIVICIILMVTIMFGLVLTRYFLSFSPSWSEEITRFAMVYLVSLGVIVLSFFDDHITFYGFVDRLRGRARTLHALLVHGLVLMVAGLVAWTGFGFAASMVHVRAPGSGLSMMIPILAIPMSMTAIALLSLLQIAQDLRLLTGRTPWPMPRQARFMDSSFRATDNE